MLFEKSWRRRGVHRLRRRSSGRRSLPMARIPRLPLGGSEPPAKPCYYDEAGRSLRRFFLKSPLRFEPHVTSHFSRSRLHPVHQHVIARISASITARRTGPPVVAVAAGMVVSAGWAAAAAIRSTLRHAGGFESYYLHLSSFAKGIRAGTQVDQGQLIGRVGATGTATGAASGLSPEQERRLRGSASGSTAGSRRASRFRIDSSTRFCTRRGDDLLRRIAADPLHAERSPRRTPDAVRAAHYAVQLKYADGVDPSVPCLAAGSRERGCRLLRPLRRRQHRGSACSSPRNPLSFLRVTRSEIDLPPDADPYAARSTQRARENFADTARESAARDGRDALALSSTACAWAATSRPGSPAAFPSTNTSET